MFVYSMHIKLENKKDTQNRVRTKKNSSTYILIRRNLITFWLSNESCGRKLTINNVCLHTCQQRHEPIVGNVWSNPGFVCQLGTL